MSEQQQAEQSGAWEIRPVTPATGAEVSGVVLSDRLGEEDIVRLREALARHKVLFFRGQGHLDDAAQEAFAARLGQPFAHPTVPSKEGTGYILDVDSQHGGRADQWHTDITFLDAYPSASILRAVVVPEAGGDTVWANTAAAYESLPQELKELAERLWAVHSNDFDYAVAAQRKGVPLEQERDYRQVFASTVYETEHPLVRVLPDTGEKALVLGSFAKRILNVSTSASRQLLELFQEHVVRLNHTVRWRWEEGDVVIWDNRATQHVAVNDYGEQRRIVRRVTLAGDVPVSVEGKQSRTRTAGGPRPQLDPAGA
ncbi:TauD/TfdA dioxygenase family protein [Paenibacillus pasadenensis]|uniref:Alpha-ketoglutarate-dependent sulfate ester dioxygenase n=1 Tax=Paenibacillus pasadenensis TaxID=217090 RepID=A0A2N5N7L2_9BACL|nr:MULTISPECIES: TauD/TfdA family dioxygenase [Paenibacillus]PLT46313.1 Alpha-ketoglutarate-dependent taurine dioxygenase [Paenibacillus pasadenensis]QGG56757.1 TauD/TfdA family dioxygenase [Paenibacillus sp. B01]